MEKYWKKQKKIPPPTNNVIKSIWLKDARGTKYQYLYFAEKLVKGKSLTTTFISIYVLFYIFYTGIKQCFKISYIDLEHKISKKTTDRLLRKNPQG